ncbi:hypothetical protein HI113_23195 [Corallococcus exiguus]|uniref:hypothetical protein n=1 Tax=Corallococcus exiguus TaxID=83462 RepID=UPI0014744FF7|nr:hypothetical protein [Corallococcus exiguus]NNB96810.1 hypothetical protein [Corallococcus exiguus]
MLSDPTALTSRIIFIGLIIEALETWQLRRSFDPGGLFSRSSTAILTSGISWHGRIGATTGGSLAIASAMTLQVLAATLATLEGTHTYAGTLAALTCLLTHGYLRSRRQIGGSGSEQLTFIFLITFFLVILAGGSDSARRVGDVFIAAQVLLAYFTAGVAKAISPIWRHGGALANIMSTEGYGTTAIARLLTNHPTLDRALCWAVIAWEISFPLVLIAPDSPRIAFISSGVAFHLSCAFLLGLNRFVWSFCGCYSAIWATAVLLE